MSIDNQCAVIIKWVGSITTEEEALIVVEGPDGAGKTTLIKHLSEHFSLPVADRVVSKDTEAMVDIRRWVNDNLDEGPQAVIFDRHRLISEPIYGALLRPEVRDDFRMPWKLLRYYRRFYLECDPLLIWCLPPFEVVEQNVAGDEDNKRVRDRIKIIYDLYTMRAAVDVIHGWGVIHDYTDDPTSTQVAEQEVSRWLRNHS